MSDSETLATMRTELESLRGEIERLRTEVKTVRQRPGASLKSHNLCPVCGGRSVLHANEIRDRSHGSDKTPMALQVEGIVKERNIGVFQAYICRTCEFTEWYVSGAGDIDPMKLDKANRKKVRIIDGEPPTGGAFR